MVRRAVNSPITASRSSSPLRGHCGICRRSRPPAICRPSHLPQWRLRDAPSCRSRSVSRSMVCSRSRSAAANCCSFSVMSPNLFAFCVDYTSRLSGGDTISLCVQGGVNPDSESDRPLAHEFGVCGPNDDQSLYRPELSLLVSGSMIGHLWRRVPGHGSNMILSFPSRWSFLQPWTRLLPWRGPRVRRMTRFPSKRPEQESCRHTNSRHRVQGMSEMKACTDSRRLLTKKGLWAGQISSSVPLDSRAPVLPA